MSKDRRAIALALAAAIAIPAEGLRQYAYYDPPFTSPSPVSTASHL